MDGGSGSWGMAQGEGNIKIKISAFTFSSQTALFKVGLSLNLVKEF